MTSKERIDNVMMGKPVDRHPVIPLYMRYAAKLSNIPFSQYCRDYKSLVTADMKTHELFHCDMVSVISDALREASDLGAGVQFPHDGVPSCKDYLIKEHKDLSKLRPIDPSQSERMLDRIKGVELFRQELGESVPILGWIEGALAQACDLRGVQETFMDTIDNPQFVFDLLEFTCDLELRFAEAQIGAGAEWIGIGESVGSLISNDTYETFALPYMKKMVDGIHKMNARARLHICGDITHILNLMSTIDVDIVDLDWMVNIETAREKLGPSICLAGNFDPVTVLQNGTPAEIKKHVQEAAMQAGQNYMICPGCEVTPDTPRENMLAFCPGK